MDGATVDGASLVLTYDQDLDPDSVPAPGDFEVTVAGSSVTVSDVSIRGKKVTLTLATPAAVGDEAAISYTVPGSNPIQDEDENAAAAFADKAVTNRTPDTTAAGPQFGRYCRRYARARLRRRPWTPHRPRRPAPSR